SVSDLRIRLLREEPEVLAFRDVPDARVSREKAAEELLRAGTLTTAGALREAVERMAGVDPEEFWKLADELPYEVAVGWSAGGARAAFDAVLRRRQRRALETAICSSPLKAAAGDLANSPMQGRIAHQVVPDLRAYLRQ